MIVAARKQGRFEGQTPIALPPGTRTPQGWPTVAIGSGPASLLSFDAPHEGETGGTVSLRLTVALEVWEHLELEVSWGESAQVIVTVDHCDVFEPLDISLPPGDLSAATVSGFRFRLRTGTGPLRVFEAGPDVPVEYQPHLFVADRPSRESVMEAFGDRMQGLGSLQQFGWKEGCVLEGLLDLADATGDPVYTRTAQRHLSCFLAHRGELHYEDPWGRPADGAVYGIEGTLPFVSIERLTPGAPVVDRMLDYFSSARRRDGALFDEGMISTEGAYTVAYPLTYIGLSRGDDALIDDALQQLRLRTHELVGGDVVYLRSYPDGRRTYPNWIRATTWHLLGLVRVLELLPRGTAPDLESELRRAAAETVARALPNGLWSCFTDDPVSGVETSGSAGIAAALARGSRAGLLDDQALEASSRTCDALTGYLTPDGYLGGASQANKDGERLQREEYRILSQVGMGLFAQLLAALDK